MPSNKATDPELVTTFGRNFRKLRTALNMSQEDAAESLGIHRITVVRLENGQNNPDWDFVCRVADMFGVTTEDLRTEISDARIERILKRMAVSA